MEENISSPGCLGAGSSGFQTDQLDVERSETNTRKRELGMISAQGSGGSRNKRGYATNKCLWMLICVFQPIQTTSIMWRVQARPRDVQEKHREPFTLQKALRGKS